MSCPHSLHGSPASCSQCLGHPARRVDNAGPVVTIDAQPTERTLDPSDERQRYYARRGGRRRRPQQ